MQARVTDVLMPSAFTAEALFERYDDYVLHLTRVVCGAREVDVQQDIAQETWTWVVTHPEKLSAKIAGLDTASAEREVRIWLAGVVRNCCRKYRSFQQRETPDTDLLDTCSGTTDSFFESSPGSMRAPDSSMQEHTVWATVQAWIGNADQFQAFGLRVFGWDPADIAAFQNVTLECALKRLELARKKVQERLDKRDRSVLPVLGLPATVDELVEELRDEPALPSEDRVEWRERMSRVLKRPGTGKPPSQTAPWLMAAITATTIVSTMPASPRRAASDFFEIWPEPNVQVLPVLAPEQPTLAVPSVAPVQSSIPKRVLTMTKGRRVLPSSSSAPSLPATTSPSKLLILRMALARRNRDYRLLLTLAQQHAREFPDQDADVRERERAVALEHIHEGQ